MGRVASLVLSSTVVAGLSSSAFAAGINDYAFKRSFTLSSANGGTTFDALPDGRLITVNGSTVSVETAADSGSFTTVGSISGFTPASYGASFLSVSPDGTRAAIGNNNGSVTVFNTAAPAIATSYSVGDYDANWADNGRLAISNYNGVQVLNTATGQVSTVIGNVGGYSGGVTFDAAGNLYTGNGYDNAPGGTDTGWIKAFSKTSWEAAAAGGPALNFEAGGVAVADLLSAGSLGFDNGGNFYVGGADTFGSGDGGYVGLVDAAALQAALASGSTTPSITAASSAGVLRKLSGPAGAFSFPSVNYNAATGELYVSDNGTINVYSVPEPAGLCGLALLGVAALRRRRRAVVATAVVATTGVASAGYVYDPTSFATEVVSSAGFSGTGLYADPNAVLGRPTLKFNNGNAASPDFHRVKLIEGTYNTGTNGEKLLTTFNAGQSVTVKMGRTVTNDASHPYGIDLIVYGNSFFGGSGGFASETTNLNTFTLGSGLFSENVRVSVSPDNVNWYTYSNGPTGDGYLPTNSYRWDRTAASWTDDELDPTKPINPALYNSAAFAGKTAADALDLYDGAAGGTGFDLSEAVTNGGAIFSAIQYVRFDGLTGYSGGEIDAVAAVPEPAMVGLAGLLAIAGLRRNRA